jgi:hypothetical protein
MRRVQVLPNELFDDGSLECKTWVFATANYSYLVAFDKVKAFGFGAVVAEAVQRGSEYINVEPLAKRIDGELILEIQWD